MPNSSVKNQQQIFDSNKPPATKFYRHLPTFTWRKNSQYGLILETRNRVVISTFSDKKVRLFMKQRRTVTKLEYVQEYNVYINGKPTPLCCRA